MDNLCSVPGLTASVDQRQMASAVLHSGNATALGFEVEKGPPNRSGDELRIRPATVKTRTQASVQRLSRSGRLSFGSSLRSSISDSSSRGPPLAGPTA